LVGIAETASFGGAAGGVVLGVEVQNEFFAGEIRQGNGGLVLVDGLEGWGSVARFQMGHGG
jgi:hypothetical protein